MRKFLVAVLSAICAFLCCAGFSGCKKEQDESGTLYVCIHDSGYGTAFIDEVAKAYESRTGIKIKKIEVAQISDLIAQLESGVSNADIMMSSNTIFKYVYRPYKAGKVEYDCLIEDLTDIVEQKIPGEEKSMKEKMMPAFRNFQNFYKDGSERFYSVPWINGMNGILINKNTWNAGWKLPRTTDEFYRLCDTIKSSGQIPMIYCLEDSYWGSGIAPVWAAQYMGREEIGLFSAGKDIKGNQYVPEMMNYNGFLEAMKVVETLLDEDRGYNSALSKSLDFTSVQNVFLEGNEKDGRIVMCPSGDWIEREMQENYEIGECNIEIMKVPVISALGTKLGITEKELSDIIGYIDGEIKSEPDFNSEKGLEKEEVIEKIRFARSLTPAYALASAAFIPVYSNEKENAKKFLQFMASDEGIEKFVSSSHGYTLPYEYDYLNSPATKDLFSNFQRNAIKAINGSELFEFAEKDKIFSLGYLALPGQNLVTRYETMLAAGKDSSTYKNAETIFMDDYLFVKSRWRDIKLNSGIA